MENKGTKVEKEPWSQNGFWTLQKFAKIWTHKLSKKTQKRQHWLFVFFAAVSETIALDKFFKQA